MPKLEAYNKKLDYSYALGVFPSLNLLESRPEAAMRLLLHTDSLENEGVTLLRENRSLLDEVSEYLLAKETITGEELMAYVNAQKADSREEAQEE